MQEVMLEVWRLASRFDPARGSGTSWVMTLAHRRAIDRVRSERSHAIRELRAATAVIDYDDVIEAVETRLDAQRVQRCLASLTPLQHECVGLAYYGGYTHPQGARLLGVPAPAVQAPKRGGLDRPPD